MIKFGRLKSMLSSTLCKIKDLGGEVEEVFISPKGLYSKPKDENAISLPVMDGGTQNAILALQERIKDLEDGDVRLTDGVNEIDLSYDGKTLKMTGKDLAQVLGKNVAIDAEETLGISSKKDLSLSGVKGVSISTTGEVSIKCTKLTIISPLTVITGTLIVGGGIYG